MTSSFLSESANSVPDWRSILRTAGIPRWRVTALRSLAELASIEPIGRSVEVDEDSANARLAVRLRATGSLWTLGPFRGVYSWEDRDLLFSVGSGDPPRGAFSAEGGVAFSREREGAVTAWVISPPPLPEAPLGDWLAHAEEPWLAREVRIHAGSGTPWGRVLGAGTLWRLRRERAEAVIAAVDALFERGEPLPDAPDEAWARGWSPEQTLAVTLYAVSAADTLLADMEHLEVALADAHGSSYASAPSTLAVLRRRRDALAGASRLLAVAPSYRPGQARVTAHDLTTVLALVDAVGCRLRASVQGAAEPGDDPLLRRAGAMHAGSWWGAGYRDGRDGGDGAWTGLDG